MIGTINQNSPTPDMTRVDCCSVAVADRHPECLPIEVDNADVFTGIADLGCMDYVRSAIVPKMGCVLGPRDQVNQATHFLDGSTIYGSTDQGVARLREFESGKAKTKITAIKLISSLYRRSILECSFSFVYFE